MSEAISKAYSMMDASEDFNPTITPVLDLSDVRKEAGNINSILGDNSIQAAYDASRVSGADANTFMMNAINSLLSKMDTAANSNQNNFNTYVTVDGAENPEDFADRLVRQFEIEMRTVYG